MIKRKVTIYYGDMQETDLNIDIDVSTVEALEVLDQKFWENISLGASRELLEDHIQAISALLDTLKLRLKNL